MEASASAESKTWEVIAAFAFGVVFVVAILIIAFFRPNPTPFEYTVFRIIIALAAAGVGAILPGFLDISFKNWLRAGGALALFVVVYFFAPAAPTVLEGSEVIEPTSDAKAQADHWLSLVDERRYGDAYSAMAEDFKKKYPFSQFEELLGRERSHLGSVKSREFFSSTPFQSPPGAPKGAYRQYVYRTSFEREQQAIYELVWLVGENQDWRVNGFYTMVKSASGQFGPYEP